MGKLIYMDKGQEAIYDSLTPSQQTCVQGRAMGYLVNRDFWDIYNALEPWEREDLNSYMRTFTRTGGGIEEREKFSN